jgi:hypothetical protein
LLVKDYNNRNKRTDVFIRVHYKDWGHGNYYAWYSKLGSMENMKSILADEQSFVLGYDIKEMFSRNMPRFYYERDVIDDVLRVDVPMELGQKVMVTNEGDYTMERARVYEVVTVGERKDIEIEKIEKQIEELREKSKLQPWEIDREERRLYDVRKKYFPAYGLKLISGKDYGVKAVKRVLGTLSTEETRSSKLGSTILKQLAGEDLQALQAEMHIRDMKLPVAVMSQEEIQKADELSTNGQIKSC